MSVSVCVSVCARAYLRNLHVSYGQKQSTLKDVYSKITQQGQQGFDNSANTSVGSLGGSTGPGRSLLSRIALFVTVLPRDAVTIVRTVWRSRVCVCVCVCVQARGRR